MFCLLVWFLFSFCFLKQNGLRPQLLFLLSPLYDGESRPEKVSGHVWWALIYGMDEFQNVWCISDSSCRTRVSTWRGNVWERWKPMRSPNDWFPVFSDHLNNHSLETFISLSQRICLLLAMRHFKNVAESWLTRISVLERTRPHLSRPRELSFCFSTVNCCDLEQKILKCCKFKGFTGSIGGGIWIRSI